MSAEFEELKLWGKIHGINKDYFIAIGLKFSGVYEFPHKTFFWCSSGNWTFAELPPINPRQKDIAETQNSLFYGEVTKVLHEAAPEQQEEQEEQKEEEEKPADVLEYPSSVEEEEPPPENFTELERLTYTVRAIE